MRFAPEMGRRMRGLRKGLWRSTCRDSIFQWAELTSDGFKGLDPERTIAVLPVAAIEQHGPHLPVMTDTAIARGHAGAAARATAAPICSVLVLPIQSIGKSNEHLLSPGTLTLSADTLLRVLVETGESVRRAGLAQADAGELPRRQRLGAGDACARASRALRHAGGADALALVRPAGQDVRRSRVRGTASMPATSRPR